jgi:hypothetical protein
MVATYTSHHGMSKERQLNRHKNKSITMVNEEQK